MLGPALSQLAWAHPKAVEPAPADASSRASRATPATTPAGERWHLRSSHDALWRPFVAHKTVPHLVWGRVVPDIPDFCRELVAALAEE
jgi:hypothetical protein